ncbi:MAG: SUMF1/EgtB/PvdO family nonheme iron enzyme [Gemmatimonadota bacterium]
MRIILLCAALAAATLPAAAAAQAPGDTLAVTVPGTEVTLVLAYVPAPRPFWMAVTETTHDQYAPFRYRRLDQELAADATGAAIPFDADAVTRPSPPYEDPVQGMGQGSHPAGGMTRLAALRYARWLSEKTGRLFRLPAEAEWEAACLAGGAEPVADHATAADAALHADSALHAHAIPDATAWFEANSAGAFHPVREKAPNVWGLHDMLGNVAEWVMEGPPDEWTAEQAAARGVVRGGAFDDPPTALHCHARFEAPAAWQRRDPQIPKSRWWNTDAPHVGFRVVMAPEALELEHIEAFWARLLGPP